MDKNELLKTARLLSQVDKDSAAEYSDKRDALVDKMNKIMAARPDLADMIGENNSQMMMDNNANQARFMESIFIQHNPEMLVDTLMWVFRAYRSRNFSPTYWSAQLNGWIEVYKEQLSQECFKAIYPYYNWMQINIPVFNKLADESLNLQSPPQK